MSAPDECFASPIEASCSNDLPERLGDRLRYEDTREDNNLRACFAATAVKAYGARSGLGKDEAVSLVIGDLLADLRHLADALGLDFADLDTQGLRRYVPELTSDV